VWNRSAAGLAEGPFFISQKPNAARLKPELVAQIEFTEWTPDGHLRHVSNG
jgi:ATP-dependent DNA ligase